MKFQGQNNTMETSSAFRTHSIWSSTINAGNDSAAAAGAQPAFDAVSESFRFQLNTLYLL